MEVHQCLHMLAVVLSCLLVATVWCEEEQQQAGSQLHDVEVSQPQKRSIANLPAEELPYAAGYPDEDMDKRSSLFRFGKRSSLFRFGKRGSLFRFGKRGSLFRFGKRSSLFRFGKRDGDMADEWEMYPDVYVSDDDLKRAVKSFHWGRETEE